VTDQIATTRIFRMWTIPGWASEDAAALQIMGSVLGGLNSSRLDNALVRGEQIAVSVSAGAQAFEDMGVFTISAEVKPGVDPALVGRRVDEITAQLLAEGPTADEVRRSVMSGLSGQLSGLESVGGFGGKAVALAQSQLFTGDPAYFQTQIRRFASTTPEQVRDVSTRWLSRPTFSLTYRPGPRTDTGDGRGGAVTAGGPEAAAFAADYYRAPITATERTMGTSFGIFDQAAPAAATPAAATPAPGAPAATTPAPRQQPPALRPINDLDFPTIERATLRNGVRVVFARRSAVPVVHMQMNFSAGSASDPRERLGLQSLALDLMEEGTTTQDSRAIAEIQERLGASIYTSSDFDTSTVGVYSLTTTLRPALALWAEIVRNPAFAPAEIERLRTQRLAGIAQELNNPGALGNRALAPVLYGDHPYGNISASGTVSSVRSITRDHLTAFHARAIRPDNATIFAVGDITLRQLVRELNRAIGDWRAPATQLEVTDYTADIPTQTPRILLVNRPNSPQSVVIAAQVLNVHGADDLLNLRAANDVLGGNFLSRINMNLRESKGWSYGASSSIGSRDDRLPFVVRAPVQADRTGDTIREIQNDVGGFLTTRGVAPDELSRTVNGSIRELPGSFETAPAVLGGIVDIVENQRPDNYYETLAARYRNMTAADLDTALRAQVDPSRFVYIVVGDIAVVRPQLDAIGLPVETVDPATLGGQ
jgi:zinc protease